MLDLGAVVGVLGVETTFTETRGGHPRSREEAKHPNLLSTSDMATNDYRDELAAAHARVAVLEERNHLLEVRVGELSLPRAAEIEARLTALRLARSVFPIAILRSEYWLSRAAAAIFAVAALFPLAHGGLNAAMLGLFVGAIAAHFYWLPLMLPWIRRKQLARLDVQIAKLEEHLPPAHQVRVAPVDEVEVHLDEEEHERLRQLR